MKRIGILTSGGDCQGLNSTIRAVGKSLYNSTEVRTLKFTELSTATEDLSTVSTDL